MQKKEIIGELTENELRALIPQLQSLTEKYKRSERIQKALFHISELASSLDDFDSFYAEIHDIVAGFMLANNFFVAFYDPKSQKIHFEYFVDERDQDPIKTLSYDQIKNGVTAHVLRSGESLVLTKENFKALQTKHQFEILGTPPVDLLGVPLMRDNQVIGAMVVQSYNDNIRYDADDLEILVFISQHIVIARDRVIQRDLTESLIAQRTNQLVTANHALEEEVLERARMEKLQKTLFDISELSTKAEGNIIDFYSKLHHAIKQLINAENCYVAILDSTLQNLQFPYFIGREQDFHSTRKLTRGLTEFVIRSKETLLVDGHKINELVENHEVDRKFVIRMLEEGNSWMGAPLMVDNEVKGIIAVQTYGEGEDYDESDLSLLRFVSQHISVAIERREAAHELVIYNQQLSIKVQERTAELNESNQSLKKEIEQRKEIELKLTYDAHHDGLTNLPNRVMFNCRLALAIASKQRYPEHNFALLFIDLDRFKKINDTLGHHAGDEFLIEASNRIGDCKRGHDLLARIGGDEFVILVDNFHCVADVEAIAQRIVNTMSKAFVIEEKEVFSGASIGIAEITKDYMHADNIMRDADAAMYQAKHLGRNRYVLFDISMRNQLMEEIDDEVAFRNAFKAGEFEYAVQAIKHLRDDSILFYECTIYWPHHATCVDVESFWQLADKCGLTYAINKQLMAEALRILHSWQRAPKFKHAKIGVSLTIEHLLHKSSFEDLVHQIETSEISSDLLVIEISEHALTRFTKYLPAMLNKLQLLGVTLVLDNFGSQSGELNHLFKYDFDYLKLNKKLVNSLNMSEKYYRLAKSIVLVANEMGIGVIANGVNDSLILQEVAEIGCHFSQGNYINAPKKVDTSCKLVEYTF